MATGSYMTPTYSRSQNVLELHDVVGRHVFQHDVLQRVVSQCHSQYPVHSRAAATPACALPVGEHLLHPLLFVSRREAWPPLHALAAHRRIFPLCYLGVECRMLSQHILLEFLLRTVESWSSVAHFVFHEEGKASLGTGRYLSYSLPATSGFEIILPKTGKSRVCPDGKLAPR
ncbi:uncharacterized protein TNCV_549291 [Trichonephila clavipes]|nr:uncharacterized protein TNCV_549291 [Trichonephila clavipes]